MLLFGRLLAELMHANNSYPFQQLVPDNLYRRCRLPNRFINKVIDRVLSLPSNVAGKIHSTDWFEQSVLLPQYQQRLQHHQPQLPTLSADDLSIIEQIEQNGVYITSLDALAIPNSQSLLTAARQITTELCQRSRLPDHVHKHTLTATASQLMAHPEIFFWGISERILQIVEGYLGLPVAYDGASFFYSVADGRDAGPRLWHRDQEDWKMIKVAVYFNDVDEWGGPFQCIKPDINRKLIATLPKYQRMSHSDLQLRLNATSSDWLTSCVGKAGTVIFADTARCYHRGKPPVLSDRSAIFFHYFSQYPKNPFYCDRSFLSRQQISSLTQQLSPSLQHHLTWKNRYPGIGRYIPKNRVRVDG